MSYYMVEDTELSSVATAIRAVTGGTANLRWPDEYIAELDKMEFNPLASWIELGVVPGDLNATSWSAISAVALAGLGDEFWDIGDCKAITLNGNIGDYFTFPTNTVLWVYILEFNQDIGNYRPDNNIIFGGFKTSGDRHGVSVALCDSKYGNTSSDGSKAFNIEHWALTYPSYNFTDYMSKWYFSDLRYDILGATSTSSAYYGTGDKIKYGDNIERINATLDTIDYPVPNTLMATLPEDFRNVLRLLERYIPDSFTHTGSNDMRNYCIVVYPTIDAISLMDYFEILENNLYLTYNTGTDRYVVTYPFSGENEKSYNHVFSYYTEGNEKIKYNFNNNEETIEYFTASCIIINTARTKKSSGTTTNSTRIGIIKIDGSGAQQDTGMYDCLGLVPIFKV